MDKGIKTAGHTPVAWRWRNSVDEPWQEEHWNYLSPDAEAQLRAKYKIVEPLFPHPPSNSHEEKHEALRRNASEIVERWASWIADTSASMDWEPEDIVGIKSKFEGDKRTLLLALAALTSGSGSSNSHEELVEALRAARKTMRNVFSAISTNQVGDKDATGQLRDGMAGIDGALSKVEGSTNG